jgi:lysophospholipase L1-like esterase
MMSHFTVLLAVMAGIAGCLAAAMAPVQAASSGPAMRGGMNGGRGADQPMPQNTATFMPGHQQLLEKAKKGGIDIYFLGDSITRRWQGTDDQHKPNWDANFWGWNAGNFGWGGDTTQNVIWRLQNGELDGVNPKIIALLIGTNNVGTTVRTQDDAFADEVARGVKRILDICREKAPQAVIILTGITPRNDDARQDTALMPTINKINERIAKFADGKMIRYININDKLADKDGKLFEGMTRDNLHLVAKGYQVWADALKPIFTELLGPPAKEDHAPPATGVPGTPNVWPPTGIATEQRRLKPAATGPAATSTTSRR